MSPVHPPTSPPTSPPPPPRCGSRAESRTLSLPVLANPKVGSSGVEASPYNTIARSKAGKWRALVLTLVNLAIAGHIAMWLLSGMRKTLSPVEPSESMQAMERGIVNAGFVFFAAALLSTLLLGRFFCGWGCHIVSLQDLCGWAMKKMGVRPKPFRSRLLLWVPLGMGLYMFVWPTVKRSVVKPLADRLGGNEGWEALAPYLGEVGRFPGWSTRFYVEDFWATFPPVYVAVPFLLIVGFAIVYVLGAKGFCFYGCPYGGFFAPVDLLAPGKIRVTDACEGCGHCTAVCTSNVRVHEEVRDFGMVVDPGCMKCLDCISVCPNDALYFGFGTPTILAQPRTEEAKTRRAEKARKPHDLSLREELFAAVVLIALLVGFRGMFNEVPLLMAVGMAAIGAAFALRLVAMIREPSVRLQSLQLKLKGRVRPLGYAFVLFAALYLAAGVWGGAVKYTLWKAAAADGRVTDPLEMVYRPEYSAGAGTRARAEEAIRWYLRSNTVGTHAEGTTVTGIGWPLSVDAKIRMGYLSLVAGRPAEGERYLRTALAEAKKPRDDLPLTIARLIQARSADTADGGAAEFIALYTTTLAAHTDLDGVRRELARLYLATNRPTDALALAGDAVTRYPDDPRALLGAAAVNAAANTPAEAAALAERAVALKDATPAQRLEAAGILLQTGHADHAITLAQAAASPEAATNPALLGGAAGLLQAAGRPDLSAPLIDRLASLTPTEPGPAVAAANVFLQAGQPDRALPFIERAVAAATADRDPWTLLSAGSLFLYAHAPEKAKAAITTAMSLRAHDLDPIFHHDYATACAVAGQGAEAAAAMVRAAELGPTNPVTAARAAELLAALGDEPAAAKWRAEAERRTK